MITRRRVVPDLDDTLLKSLVAGLVPPGSSVLDMGAGLRGSYQPMLARWCDRLVLLDAHEPYLKANETARLGLPNVETVCGVAPGVLNTLGQFDYVLGIDFLEHMEIEPAIETIVVSKKIGSVIALFVPEGNHPQSHDYYEMGGDYWQTHRTSWRAEYLEAQGFDVTVLEGYHAPWRRPTDDQNALWCVWRNS